ncbi:NAD kinase [Neomicrococcus aestuarii]|uniref:NAD kinase n=1 Tax=Neomicrococcus aestuarii TaxID=556325 RepID=A0A1L2ZM96_9MICC|nr:NAD kinase [Neomicrococcus aestuarii]APF40269.1 NAD kinase [Neomicrococcus aestuarii]
MRHILVLAHTGRSEAVQSAVDTCHQLVSAGLMPVIRAADLDCILEAEPSLVDVVKVLDRDVPLDEIELGMVLGGDGTILRSAEIVRDANPPMLGVNLGHVGFLAESEHTELTQAVQRVVNRQYVVEERMTIDVEVWLDHQKIAHTWALNEATVEKADRERMLEVVIEVDANPISTFGCDGVVMATPTGSTAYAFSAGGPVVWPEVSALVMVPIAAHALFAKPLVVSPASTMAVEVLTRTDAQGVLWCDGRRTVELPPGARVEVTRSAFPVRLARLSETPFAERLVRKFELPIKGWRGPVPTTSRDAPTTAIPVIREADVVEPPHNTERLQYLPGHHNNTP